MLKDWKLRVLIITIMLSGAYTFWIAPLKPIQIVNLKILDTFISLSARLYPMPAIGKNIILVTVDDESLREVNIQWPWPRSLNAEIIRKVSEAGTSLICIDFVYAGKSSDPLEDASLISAINNAKNVFGASFFGDDGKYIIPDEAIAIGLKEFGFVNKPRDADATIRRMRPLMISASGKIIDYSLSLKIASYLLNVPWINLAANLPLSDNGTAYIRFYGNESDFCSIPAWKILKGDFDASLLKNKIVFLGATSESFHDTYHTPLGRMSGLLIDINETLTYINKSFFGYASKNANFIILFAFVLIAVVGGMRLPILSGFILSCISVAIFLVLEFVLFQKNIIIDSIGPISLVFISTMLLHGARYVILIMENIVLKREAITDGLTGLYLYRYFELQLKRGLEEAFKKHKNYALVIYDIDHFKKINDTYGHEFGNIILKNVAKNLMRYSRKNNLIARYGGEEFCIIVPEMKRDDAIKYAERLRNMISGLEFRTDKNETVKITMSAGIVTIEDAISQNPSDFVKEADVALYMSKNTGRDKISVFNKNSDSITT